MRVNEEAHAYQYFLGERQWGSEKPVSQWVTPGHPIALEVSQFYFLIHPDITGFSCHPCPKESRDLCLANMEVTTKDSKHNKESNVYLFAIFLAGDLTLTKHIFYHSDSVNMALHGIIQRKHCPAFNDIFVKHTCFGKFNM